MLLLAPLWQRQLDQSHKYQQHRTKHYSLLDYSVYNRNGLTVHLSDCVPAARQNCIVLVRFTGNQNGFRQWSHYSISITLCNPHFLHDDRLKQTMYLLPVKVKIMVIVNHKKIIIHSIL